MMDFTKPDLKELACLIYETLKNSGIKAVLVGGACVSIYSHNQYQSFDLDFATYEDLKSIEKALAKLGFKRIGRQFSRDQCPYLIDFVNPPISVGHEAIHQFSTVNTSTGSLQLLSPTDCVKDRLASFFHWDDIQGLEQALMVAKNHFIDLKDLKLWATKEGFEKKLDKFLGRYQQNRKNPA
jgi:hypothetical protein